MEQVSPLTDLYTLGLDNLKSTALKLPFNDLISLCKTSKKFSNICNDIYFWKSYFVENVHEKVNIPENADINWYKQKLKDYPAVKRVNEIMILKKSNYRYIQEEDENWDIFERIENLQKLNCNNSQLTSLPSMPNLQRLYCENNQLTSLAFYPNLQYLYCNDNRLISLPYLPNLQELFCQHNRLTSLPYLPNLQVLDCNNNRLTSIPSMPTLRGLYCENNQLTSIPSMPNLQYLYCANNQLTSLPSMPNLRVLYCEDNPLPGFTLDYWRKIWKENNYFII